MNAPARLPALSWPRSAERLRQVLVAAGLGILLALLDLYWGKGRGKWALAMLAMGTGAAQAAEYFRAVRLLRLPRLPDALLAAGAGHADRRALACAAADRILRSHGPAALLAGLAALAAQFTVRPGFAAVGLALLTLESLLLWAGFRAAFRFGGIAPSRAPFHGRSGEEASWLRRLGPAWLDLSARAVLKATARLPAPYAWLIRRKALHVLRGDPVAPFLFLPLAAVSAVAFRASGNLVLCGLFALAGCMAALALARRAASGCDRFAASHPWLFPPSRVLFRSDWAFALLLAAPFPLYYSACAASLLGIGPALRAQSVWQMASSALAFACLIARDGHVQGRREPAQAMLAGGYLGIAAILFMFPGYGLAISMIAAGTSAAVCARAARK